MRKITLGNDTDGGCGDYDDDGERRGLIYSQKGCDPIVISLRLSVEFSKIDFSERLLPSRS